MELSHYHVHVTFRRKTRVHYYQLASNCAIGQNLENLLSKTNLKF